MTLQLHIPLRSHVVEKEALHKQTVRSLEDDLSSLPVGKLMQPKPNQKKYIQHFGSLQFFPSFSHFFF